MIIFLYKPVKLIFLIIIIGQIEMIVSFMIMMLQSRDQPTIMSSTVSPVDPG